MSTTMSEAMARTQGFHCAMHAYHELKGQARAKYITACHRVFERTHGADMAAHFAKGFADTAKERSKRGSRKRFKSEPRDPNRAMAKLRANYGLD